MPGESHSAYLEGYERLSGMEGAEEDEDERMDSTEALRAVVAEILGKNDMTKAEINNDFQVIKVDEDQRIIFGWASVTKVDGNLVVDRQGDVIRTETLHKAINEFMKGVRVGKLMHQGEQVGDIVHSFPVSKDIMDALGIQTNKEGWIVGYYVSDDTLWKSVQSGDFAEFSIGGSAQKEEFNAN